jgi:GNAT superfamily N-acetyltransferase
LIWAECEPGFPNSKESQAKAMVLQERLPLIFKDLELIMSEDVSLNIGIRVATEADVPLILSLIKDLARYEKLQDQVVATEAILQESLFGPSPRAEVIIGSAQEIPVGYALFFHSFSTFLGKTGMYIEDLYVQKAYRGNGLGKAMLMHVAELARERGCKRLEWSVLDWNEPAIRFYKSLGAVPMNGWTLYRLAGNTLDTLLTSRSE